MADLVYSNAAISAHMATYMLNQPRINAMIRARSLAAAEALLTECGYEKVTGTIDEIIEHERERAFKKFMQHCNNESLGKCVTAMYEFSSTPLTHETLAAAEDKIAAIIKDNLEGIEDDNIRNYFETLYIAFENHRKVPETTLYNIAREERYNLDSFGPIFFWYVLKQSEFKAAKAVLFGKEANLEPNAILDNLGGLYERFK
jgi:hypothetical protein